MSLSQLVASLQRLSLQAPITSSITRTTAASLHKKKLLQADHSTSFIPKCLLHMSPACGGKRGTRDRERPMMPSSRSGRWEPMKPMRELYPEYTTEPLPFPRTGGRGPNGRIWNFRRGGGLKREFRMIDWQRTKPDQKEDLVERVDQIIEDKCRSAFIALVVGGEQKRWIVATQNMKPGDLIKSSRKLSKIAVRANEGDAYPVGSLPIGTLVNCLERFPNDGGYFARAAGVTAQVVRKLDDQCVLRLPSKREVCVDVSCTATIGRVSNIDHNKRILGKAGANRWLGIRPKSGLKKKKTGRFGRKIRSPRAMKLYSQKSPPSAPVYKMTM